MLVYDLIPMQHPEIYGADGAAMFHQYIAAVIAHADLIVTISDTVANDLSLAVPSFRFPRRGPEIVPWRLGCDLAIAGGGLAHRVRGVAQALGVLGQVLPLLLTRVVYAPGARDIINIINLSKTAIIIVV